MAILLVVVAVLVVSYASSTRAWMRQHSQLVQLRQQIAASEAKIAQLQQDKARYSDNAYVEQQARERFGWVLPGQTSYQVLGSDGLPVGPTQPLNAGAVPDKTVPEAWWMKTYASFQIADNPSKAKAPPATSINTP